MMGAVLKISVYDRMTWTTPYFTVAPKGRRLRRFHLQQTEMTLVGRTIMGEGLRSISERRLRSSKGVESVERKSEGRCGGSGILPRKEVYVTCLRVAESKASRSDDIGERLRANCATDMSPPVVA